jgi:hypothetical protein
MASARAHASARVGGTLSGVRSSLWALASVDQPSREQVTVEESVVELGGPGTQVGALRAPVLA